MSSPGSRRGRVHPGRHEPVCRARPPRQARHTATPGHRRVQGKESEDKVGGDDGCGPHATRAPAERPPRRTVEEEARVRRTARRRRGRRPRPAGADDSPPSCLQPATAGRGGRQPNRPPEGVGPDGPGRPSLPGPPAPCPSRTVPRAVAGSRVRTRAGPSGVSIRRVSSVIRPGPAQPRISPVVGSTTPTSSSAPIGSIRPGPLDRLLLTARETG